MEVVTRRPQTLMAEQQLQAAPVDPGVEEVTRERMSSHMGMDSFAQSRPHASLPTEVVDRLARNRPKYSEATARGNIVPPHCFIDMFLLLLLRDLHGLTTPWEILSGDNIAENDYCRERCV